jgi:hypothetical protein
MSKTRKMVFTINNYTEADVEMVKELDCIACVAGLEVGEQGTRHIQGAVIWRNAKTFTAAQKLLCEKGKCATLKMKGTWAQQEYCKKEGRVIRDDEFAEVGQGRRTDIIALRDACKRGASDAELCDELPEESAKYQRFIGFARNAYREAGVVELPRGSKKLGTWMWSEGPNMGKTTWVRDKFGDDLYIKSGDRWWDGYANHRVVMVDDPPQRWSSTFWANIKIWCQERPFLAQSGVGEGKRKIRFEEMYVCANKSPQDYFGEDFNEEIFRSRFKVVHVLSKLY